MSGLFIVFEGGDGVGKSTQVALLTQSLTARGVSHTVTRQPGGTTLGTTLRGLILDHGHGDIAPRAEALMYAADKAQHVFETVLPALERDHVVICDRYVDSMIAYQGAGRDLDLAEVAQVARHVAGLDGRVVGRVEVVHGGHRPALAQQAVHHVAPDEARRAGHHRVGRGPHRPTPMWSSPAARRAAPGKTLRPSITTG